MLPGRMIQPVRRSQNATDFGDFPTGALTSAGWTQRAGGSTNYTVNIEASSTSISGKRANLVKTVVDGYKMFSWDRVGSVQNVEVLALLHLIQDPGGTDETTGQITVRADASGDADPYYVCLPCEVSSVKKFEIGRGDGAGGGARIGNVNKSWNTSNRWWIRFRVNGNTQKGKMWQYQTAEPTSWELDFADTNVPSAGYAGLGIFYMDANYAVLWWSVASGGNTAPAPGG